MEVASLGSRAKMRTKEGEESENVFFVVVSLCFYCSRGWNETEWNVSRNLIELGCRCLSLMLHLFFTFS